jgi:hypothetical protein
MRAPYLSEETIESLLVEVTAQRLVIRSLLAYIAVSSNQPLFQLLADFREAAEKTSPMSCHLPMSTGTFMKRQARSQRSAPLNSLLI